KYRALVIGNSDYDFINDLPMVEKDVSDVKKMLESSYGFEVDVRKNLSLSQMYAVLNDLTKFDKDDFVLIYYAGHSTLDQFDVGYWQPVDYVPGKDESTTAVSVTQVTQYLNMMRAQHVMVVVDSCYSGAILRENSVEVQNAEQRIKYWINNVSRTVLTSG